MDQSITMNFLQNLNASPDFIGDEVLVASLCRVAATADTPGKFWENCDAVISRKTDFFKNQYAKKIYIDTLLQKPAA